jgi:plastocyanin
MSFALKRNAPYLVAGLLVCAAVAVAEAPQRALAAGAPVAAKIANFAFGPPTITVHAGTAVTWTNGDEDPHTVVADTAGGFKSQALDTGDTFTQTFSTPGTYAYHCGLHPYMKGKVVVQ